MEGADSCCGGAGSYSFRHPDLSRKILNRKIDAIIRTGPHIVATSCPSCTLQLTAGLRQKGINIPVMHPMELLAATIEQDHGQPIEKRVKSKFNTISNMKERNLT